MGIETLIDDVNHVLRHEAQSDISTDRLAKYGGAMALHAKDAFSARKERQRPSINTVYASEIGDKCSLRLYYKRHGVPVNEPHDGQTELKFLTGDFVEETMLLLAEAAGHTVERRQEEVTAVVDDFTFVGHIDAVIDGRVIDIKSASDYAFNLYADKGVSQETNSFGYVEQITFYNTYLPNHSRSNPLFWVVNKNNSDHTLAPVVHTGAFDIRATMQTVVYEQEMLDGLKKHDKFRIKPVPMGKAGNMKLDTQCYYCGYKTKCYPKLRAFEYSNKVEYLTEVVEVPRVPEIPIQV